MLLVYSTFGEIWTKNQTISLQYPRYPYYVLIQSEILIECVPQFYGQMYSKYWGEIGGAYFIGHIS